MVDHASRLAASAALRPLGSIADASGRPAVAEQLQHHGSLPDSPIPVGSHREGDEVGWIDSNWYVAWDETSADLIGLSIGT